MSNTSGLLDDVLGERDAVDEQVREADHARPRAGVQRVEVDGRRGRRWLGGALAPGRGGAAG